MVKTVMCHVMFQKIVSCYVSSWIQLNWKCLQPTGVLPTAYHKAPPGLLKAPPGLPGALRCKSIYFEVHSHPKFRI